jgi:hypothetical protein
MGTKRLRSKRPPGPRSHDLPVARTHTVRRHTFTHYHPIVLVCRVIAVKFSDVNNESCINWESVARFSLTRWPY